MKNKLNIFIISILFFISIGNLFSFTKNSLISKLKKNFYNKKIKYIEIAFYKTNSKFIKLKKKLDENMKIFNNIKNSMKNIIDSNSENLINKYIFFLENDGEIIENISNEVDIINNELSEVKHKLKKKTIKIDNISIVKEQIDYIFSSILILKESLEEINIKLKNFLFLIKNKNINSNNNINKENKKVKVKNRYKTDKKKTIIDNDSLNKFIKNRSKKIKK